MALYLFDASAVVDVVLGQGGADVGIDVLFDEHWLDLTRYETANAIWKIGVARDEFGDSAVDDAIDILDRLDQEMRRDVAPGRVSMDVARKNGLTFYDAAYLAVAQRADLTLVTEDGALADAAEDQGVSTASVRAFE